MFLCFSIQRAPNLNHSVFTEGSRLPLRPPSPPRARPGAVPRPQDGRLRGDRRGGPRRQDGVRPQRLRLRGRGPLLPRRQERHDRPAEEEDGVVRPGKGGQGKGKDYRISVNNGASVEHAFFRSLAFFTERNQNLTKAEREKANLRPNTCASSLQIKNLPIAEIIVLNVPFFAL